MSSKHCILVSMIVFCFLLVSSLSNAAQSGIGNVESNKKAVSSVKMELKPLQQTLVASQLAIPYLYQLLLSTIDNVYAAEHELHNATGCMSAAIDDELKSYYKPYIKNCLTKSYSVQDQQSAGCAGTDTVNQCMDKLYKHCIGGYKGGTGNKGEFIQRFKTALDRSNDINVKSKKYSEQLQILLNNIP